MASKVYLPEAADIRRACAEIRKHWDAAMCSRRAPHLNPVEYEVPVVRSSDFGAAIEDEVEEISEL